MMAVYAPDAVELLPDTPAVVGRGPIRDFYRHVIEQYPRFAHKFEAHEMILASSGDLAVLRGSYRFIPDTLRAGDVRTGKFVGVWRKQDGDWRIQLNVSNANGTRVDM